MTVRVHDDAVVGEQQASKPQWHEQAEYMIFNQVLFPSSLEQAVHCDVRYGKAVRLVVASSCEGFRPSAGE